MNLIEFGIGAFKDKTYGTIKYGLTNLTKNSIMQQCCDNLSYIKGMYDYQKPLNEKAWSHYGIAGPICWI